MNARRRSGLLAVFLAVVVLVAGGCRIQVHVGVDVDGDGSGAVRVAVTFDEEALRRVDDLSEQLVVDDLEAAGWTVEQPTEGPDGTTVVAAEKPFATTAELGQVVEELGGAGGPFRNFTVERQTGVLTSTYTLEGRSTSPPALRGSATRTCANACRAAVSASTASRWSGRRALPWNSSSTSG